MTSSQLNAFYREFHWLEKLVKSIFVGCGEIKVLRADLGLLQRPLKKPTEPLVGSVDRLLLGRHGELIAKVGLEVRRTERFFGLLDPLITHHSVHNEDTVEKTLRRLQPWKGDSLSYFVFEYGGVNADIIIHKAPKDHSIEDLLAKHDGEEHRKLQESIKQLG
ncbi:MAG TPA: hypothetical protein VJH55_02005 [Candidatus Paceibacterota bacterium]